MADGPDYEALLAQVDSALLGLTALRRTIMREAGLQEQRDDGCQHPDPVQLDDGWYCSNPSCGQRLDGYVPPGGDGAPDVAAATP